MPVFVWAGKEQGLVLFAAMAGRRGGRHRVQGVFRCRGEGIGTCAGMRKMHRPARGRGPLTAAPAGHGPRGKHPQCNETAQLNRFMTIIFFSFLSGRRRNYVL